MLGCGVVLVGVVSSVGDGFVAEGKVVGGCGRNDIVELAVRELREADHNMVVFFDTMI